MLRLVAPLLGLATLTAAWASACTSFPDYSLDDAGLTGTDATPQADAAGRDSAVAANDDDGGPLGHTLPDEIPGCAPTEPIAEATPTVTIGDGTAASCTESAVRTVLQDAPNGAVVAFSCGAEPLRIPITSTLVLDGSKDLTLDGGEKISFDGGGTVRILESFHADFRSSSRKLVLRGLRFTGGYGGPDAYPADADQSAYSGGAVAFEDGKLYVHRCVFENNVGPMQGNNVAGGAIYAFGARLVQITQSVFTGNHASNGGAVAASQSDLEVASSRFENNVATGAGGQGNGAEYRGGSGGAIFDVGASQTLTRLCGVRLAHNDGYYGGALFRDNYEPDDAVVKLMSLERSTFDHNTARSNGAGISTRRMTVKIGASSFLGNDGSSGCGAMLFGGGTFELVNVTVAEGQGGLPGLCADGTSGLVQNCTFVDNDGTQSEAAIHGASAGITLKSSIVAHNSAQLENDQNATSCGPAPMTGGADSVQFPGTGFDDPCAAGITVAEPQLTRDDSGIVPVYVPAAGSPARAVASTDCPPTDALGVARPAAGCTAGAVQ